MLGDFFHIERIDIYLIVIIVCFVTLSILGKLPDVEDIRKFIAAFGDTGGVIIVLSCFSAWMFASSVKFFYFAIGLISAGKIDEKSSVLMVGVSWITGTAFGMFAGALLKTLTGDKSVLPPFPVSGGSATPNTAQTTTSTPTGVVTQTVQTSPVAQPPAVPVDPPLEPPVK